MKSTKATTGIPEHHKIPGPGGKGTLLGGHVSTGHRISPHIETSADDEDETRYADEDGPQPLDKLFR